MENLLSSRLHHVVVHIVVHIRALGPDVTRDEDGVFTSSAETRSSTFADVGRRR